MANIARCSIHGTSPGGEIWQFSIWVQRDIATQADADVMASDAAGAVDDSDLMTLILADDQTWTGVSAYAYQDESPAAQFVGEAARSVTGGASGVASLQTAFVVTLNSDTPGRSGRGRLYLPARRQVAAADALISTAARDGMLTAVQDVINKINVSTAPSICVVHSLTKSQDYFITAVSADQRLDVQRRRANRQTTGARAVLAIT